MHLCEVTGVYPLTKWHLLNSYRRAIDRPIRVTFSGKRHEYVHVGSTAASLPPTFPPQATRIGFSECHSPLTSNIQFQSTSALTRPFKIGPQACLTCSRNMRSARVCPRFIDTTGLPCSTALRTNRNPENTCSDDPTTNSA